MFYTSKLVTSFELPCCANTCLPTHISQPLELWHVHCPYAALKQGSQSLEVYAATFVDTYERTTVGLSVGTYT